MKLWESRKKNQEGEELKKSFWKKEDTEEPFLDEVSLENMDIESAVSEDSFWDDGEVKRENPLPRFRTAARMRRRLMIPRNPPMRQHSRP